MLYASFSKTSLFSNSPSVISAFFCGNSSYPSLSFLTLYFSKPTQWYYSEHQKPFALIHLLKTANIAYKFSDYDAESFNACEILSSNQQSPVVTFLR